MPDTALPPPEDIRLDCGPVRLAGREVLAPLRLTLTERRIGVIGRNGSGKTTLMRLIAGLIAPESGQVTIGGADPFRDRKAALRRIGILFQNPDHQILFPTAEEELAFGLRQTGLAQKDALAQARAALQAEGRAHWAQAPVAALSGGQRQYLCLLSLLLMGPGTILLDEPFTGLDLPTLIRLRRRLEALPQRLITIGHDGAALAGADRLIWMEAGRIAADGPPGAVLPLWQAEMERQGRWMLTLTSPVETPWHRLPAAAKLAALAAGTVGIFALNAPGPLAAALAGVAALHLPGGRAFLWHALRMLRPLWPFLAVVALWHLWTGEVRAGAVVLLRMVTAVAAANLVTMTTRLSDMLAVFEGLARPLAPLIPPRRLALAFALVIRFLPAMALTLARLQEAWRARSPRRPGWRVLVPGVLAALDDADHAAEALRARGGAD